MITFNHVDDFDFACGQKIDNRGSSVLNGDLAFDGSDVKSLESNEVFEEGSIRASHCEL